MKFIPSPHHYPSSPVNYIGLKVKPEAEFPKLDGTFGLRDFKLDQDELLTFESLESETITISKNLKLPFLGPRREHDPALSIYHDDHTKILLHPIEVVIDSKVLERMAHHAKKVCGKKGKDILETGGYLAGYLKIDSENRVYSHITDSFFDEPEVIGSRDMVSFDIESINAWDQRTKKEGLVHLGYWHSHPTYSPFQSDERFTGGGADVQATFNTCKTWWTCAMVIDPLSKKGMEVGCYKMVVPGKLSEKQMGWRSVAILIKGGANGR